MNAQFEFSRLQKSNLRTHYEDLAANAMLSVVRHRWLIGKIVIGALVLAALLVSVLPRKYSAEALVQPQLFSRGGEGANPAPLASIDGAALVASEAHLIQSPAIARAVVKRLGLERNGQFAPSTSLFGRTAGTIRDAVFPEIGVVLAVGARRRQRPLEADGDAGHAVLPDLHRLHRHFARDGGQRGQRLCARVPQREIDTTAVGSGVDGNPGTSATIHSLWRKTSELHTCSGGRGNCPPAIAGRDQ